MNNNKKQAIATIAEKNRIVDNIIEAISTKDNFLLVGHNHPDEDCLAAMVAFGLLLSKMEKQSYILVCSDINENYRYLLNICRFNSITVVEECSAVPPEISAMIVLDTPKPEMMMIAGKTERYRPKPEMLVMEIDHHLGADGMYCGDEGYCLVDEASSSCELIGYLAFKIRNRQKTDPHLKSEKIFTRNFVLAVLTGIIGDSKMGKYLKSNKERWFYNLFSKMFSEILDKETFSSSANLSNMKEVYNEIFRLSEDEEKCFIFMMDKKDCVPKICCAVIDSRNSEEMHSRFDHETVVNISRTVADRLAEESGYLSLVAFYDHLDHSNFIQFRMRRSESFRTLDLRDLIEKFNIENGGGHKGAIGFRIEREKMPDLEAYVSRVLNGTGKLIEKSL